MSPGEVVISGTEQQDLSSFKLTSPTVNVSRNTIENILDKGDIRLTVRDLRFYASVPITLMTIEYSTVKPMIDFGFNIICVILYRVDLKIQMHYLFEH